MFTRLLGLVKPDTDPENNEVRQFLKELMPEFDERRKHRRVPFSRATTIYFDGELVPVPAMIRDISINGMGLVHDIPVKPSEATLRIPTDCGKTICTRLRILWCRQVMRHYYISGGEFIRVFESDPITLDGLGL
jgi:hypothetical protein